MGNPFHHAVAEAAGALITFKACRVDTVDSTYALRGKICKISPTVVVEEKEDKGWVSLATSCVGRGPRGVI